MILKRLRNLRMHAEMTQEEAAKKLGLTQATYSRYENGTNEPDITTLKNIARLFDCSVDFILECDEDYTSDRPIELTHLLRSGIFTINGHFPTPKDRRKLLGLIEILYDKYDH